MEDTIELTLEERPMLRVRLACRESTTTPDPGAVKEHVEMLKALRLPATPQDSLGGLGLRGLSNLSSPVTPKGRPHPRL